MAMRGRDPSWITAKYTGTCSGCNSPIKRGDAAFYYPNTKGIYGSKCGCGDERSRDFEAARQDDAMMSGGW